MNTHILSIASILGVFSIALGALGAHLLEDYLISIERLDTFETAVKYQFYHVFFLMFLGFNYDRLNQRIVKYAFYAVCAGLLLFSGSLYLLCLTNNIFFGLVTPFGGVSFICAWLLLLLSLKNSVK